MWFLFMAATVHGTEVPGLTRYLADHAQYTSQSACYAAGVNVARTLADSDAHGGYACRQVSPDRYRDGPMRTF